MHTNRKLSERLWAAYRDIPMIPPSLTPEEREAFKGVIGNVASVTHLKATINSLISEGYRETSSLMATMRTRLQDAEESLGYYEGVLYNGTQERS